MLIKGRFILRAALGIVTALTVAAGAAYAQYTDVYDFGATPTDGQYPESPPIFDTAGNMYGTTSFGGLYGAGTVWERPATGGYMILYNFTGGSDGIYPAAGLTLDKAGNLYGSTYYGNDLYEITTPNTNPTFKLLHSFSGPDGQYPWAAVTFDSAGNLYGTCQQGGMYGQGVAYEITDPNGACIYTDLHDFGNGTDGQQVYGPITFDKAGNMWGTTSVGGQYGAGTIWEMSLTSQGTAYSIVHNFTFGADGGGLWAGVVFDSAGNAYGATQGGGTTGGGTLWKLTPAGAFSTIYTFTLAGGFSDDSPIIVDNSGNLFGVANAGGANNAGVIWEFSAAGVYTDLHDFGTGTDGTMEYGMGVVLDSSGLLWGHGYTGGAYGAGMLWSLVVGPPPAPLAVSTSRGSTPAMAGGVGVSFTTTVTLPNSNGGTITLSSGGSNALVNGSASATVSVPAGKTNATFTITAPNDVASPTPVVLTASAKGDLPATVTVTVMPFIQSIVLDKPGDVSGGSITGRVELFEAPTTRQEINLSSSISDATVKEEIHDRKDHIESHRFRIHFANVNATENGIVTATHASASSASAPFSIYGPSVKSASFCPAKVEVGQSSTLTVNLDSPVATAQTITVASSSPSVAGNVTITIPAGCNVGTGTVTTSPFADTNTADVSYTGTFNGTNISADLKVVPLVVKSVTVTPKSVEAGVCSTVIVTLTAPALTNITIPVTSSDPSIAGSTNVTILAGDTTGVGPITTSSFASTSAADVMFTASLNGISGSDDLKVTPLVLKSVKVSPSSVDGGESSTVTVTLTAPALVDTTITVSSSNSSIAGSVTVCIPAGSTSGTASISTVAIAETKNTTFTVTYSATFGGISASDTLSVVEKKS